MGFSGDDAVGSGNFSFGEGVGVLSLRGSMDDTYGRGGSLCQKPARTRKAHAHSLNQRYRPGEGQVAVYEAVDYVSRITPERGFARPGGIRTPKIFQQYEVVGYTPTVRTRYQRHGRRCHGLDELAPVKWNLEEYVKRPNDDDVSGMLVQSIRTGLFLPNEDGPNRKTSHAGRQRGRCMGGSVVCA